MTRTELIVDLLETHLPDECDIAGKTNVEDVASGSVQFLRAEHGAYLDLSDVLRTLAEVANFASSALTIYFGLAQLLEGRRPQLDELKERVQSSLKTPDGLSEETRDKLLADIVLKGESISQETSGQEEHAAPMPVEGERSED